HLHVGPLLLAFLGEFRTGHRRAVNAVAPGARAYIDHGIPDARCLRVEHIFLPANAEREHVDQRIAVVALLEDRLAAYRRHAEAIAVVRDPADHARENPAIARSGLGVVQPSEAQRIHHRDRPRAHREDVAQDAADARRRALEGFDEARV